LNHYYLPFKIWSMITKRLSVVQGPCSAVLPTVHGCHYAFQKFPFFVSFCIYTLQFCISDLTQWGWHTLRPFSFLRRTLLYGISKSVLLASRWPSDVETCCQVRDTACTICAGGNYTGKQHLFFVTRTSMDELSSTFYAEFRYAYRVFLSGRISKIQRNLNVQNSALRSHETGRNSHLNFAPPPPNAPTCPCGLRGLPTWAWQKCNRLLRLGHPWGAVTLSRWCEWWYRRM